jgi:hypothetical protein
MHIAQKAGRQWFPMDFIGHEKEAKPMPHRKILREKLSFY